MKKLISFILVGTMCIYLSIPTMASGTSNSYGYFSTFADFVKESTTTSEFADGWTNYNPVGGRPVQGKLESAANTQAMHLLPGSVVYQVFGELINSGKIHISFDVKLDDSDCVSMYLFGNDNRSGKNPYDYGFDGQNYWYNKFFRWGSYDKASPANNKLWTYTSLYSWDQKITDITLDESWHKYDIIYNMDTNKCMLYYDGNVVTVGNEEWIFNLGEKGLKNIYFAVDTSSTSVNPDYNTAKGAWIDNVCISSYDSADTWNDVKIQTEALSGGVSTLNGKLNVAFSEKMNTSAASFNAVDFTATNIITNQTVVPSSIEQKANSSVMLTFNTIPKGEYVLSYNGNVKGYQSGKAVSNTARFRTTGDIISQQSTTKRHYYLNESFDGYNGGMPAGWNPLVPDFASQAKISELTTVADPTGGKAISFAYPQNLATPFQNYTNSIYYEFDEPIISGRFTVEFDVNDIAVNNRWLMGLMHTQDLVGAERWSKAELSLNATTAEQQAYYRKFNNIVLNRTPENGVRFRKSLDYFDNTLNREVGQNGISTDNNYYSAPDNLSGTEPLVMNKTSEWNHFKIIVDLDAEKYIVTATDSLGNYLKNTTNTVVLNNFEVQYNCHKYITRLLQDAAGVSEYYSGIKGIRFEKTKSSQTWGINSTCFDNIKVYKDADYNSYSDFEGFAPSDNASTIRKLTNRAGWYNWNYASNQYVSSGVPTLDITSDGNYANNTAGTALVVGRRNTQHYVIHPFDQPIKAGAEFAVEFDIKQTSSNVLETGLRFMLLDQTDLYSRAENTLSGSTAYNGATGTATEAQGSLINQNVVLGNGSTVSDGKLYAYKGYTNWDKVAFAYTKYNEDTGETTTNNIPYYASSTVYQHLKFVVTPLGSSGTKYTIHTTDSQGNPVSAEYTSSRRFDIKDTYGCGFWLYDKNTDFSFYLDNLKAYETGGYEKVSVLSLTTEKFDGTFQSIDTASGAKTISSNTKNLSLTFTQPINETEESISNKIKLVDPTTNIKINATGSLSTNKRTYTISLEDVTLPSVTSLCVSNMLNFNTNSYMTDLDSGYSYYITKGNDNASGITGLKVEESSASTGTIQGYTIPSVWVPFEGISNKANGASLRISIKGYNTTGTSKTVMSGGASYIENSPYLKMLGINMQQIDIPAAKGEFEIAIPISDLPANATKFKTFLWSTDLTPLTPAAEY